MLQRGAGYLVESQDADGAWRDFEMPVGISDAWVTAVVTWSLLQVVELDVAPGVSEARLKGIRWLRQNRRSQGWGYNGTVSADADSTAWAMRAAPELLTEWDNRDCLRLYQVENGGVSTYPAGRRGGEWSKPHCDVTANALLAAESTDPALSIDTRRAIAFLHASWHDDGSLPAYWWASPFYTTVLAGEYLARVDPTDVRLEKALQFVLSRQNADGSWGQFSSNTVDTALCASFVASMTPPHSNSQRHASLNAAVNWLRATQMANGQWPSSPLLYVPNRHDPRQPASLHGDQRGLFSSALAVACLSHLVMPPTTQREAPANAIAGKTSFPP